MDFQIQEEPPVLHGEHSARNKLKFLFSFAVVHFCLPGSGSGSTDTIGSGSETHVSTVQTIIKISLTRIRNLFFESDLVKNSWADVIFRRYKIGVTWDCTVGLSLRVSVQRAREAVPLNYRRLALQLFILCIIFAQKRERERERERVLLSAQKSDELSVPFWSCFW